jgi:hypothetical protein
VAGVNLVDKAKEQEDLLEKAQRELEAHERVSSRLAADKRPLCERLGPPPPHATHMHNRSNNLSCKPWRRQRPSR